MPRITYIIFKLKPSGACNIYDVETIDIPNDSKVQTLLDHASTLICGFAGLAPDRIHVEVYKLRNAAGDFYCRRLGDVARELGAVDKAFFADKAIRLSPCDTLSFLESDVPRGRVVVVFTNKPPVTAAEIVDMWMNNRCMGLVPPELEDLRKLLEAPLSEAEKIPIPEPEFQKLLVSKDNSDQCTADDLRSLFRIGETSIFFYPVFCAVTRLVPTGSTKRDFISFWDVNVGKLLKFMIPRGKSFRDFECRPEYAFLLDGSCLFQGQERGPCDPQHSSAELRSNFVWTCPSLPYVLGYYCYGSKITLTAIIKPRTRTEQFRPRLYDIATLDLKFRRNRIANIRYLINLSPVLHVLASMEPSPLNDYAVLQGQGTVHA